MISFAYINRKDFVVLGGTSQAGDWSTDIYESDTKRILDGCSRLLPSLRVSWDFIKIWNIQKLPYGQRLGKH